MGCKNLVNRLTRLEIKSFVENLVSRKRRPRKGLQDLSDGNKTVMPNRLSLKDVRSRGTKDYEQTKTSESRSLKENIRWRRGIFGFQLLEILCVIGTFLSGHPLQ